MFEQYIDTMTLYVRPFVLRHHQGVLAAGKYLTHGLAIGVRHRRHRLVPAVLFGDELAAYVYAAFIDGLVIYLLHMEAVVDHVGVVKYLGGYEHHRRRQVAGYFFNPAPYRLIHSIDEYGYDFVALCSGDGVRHRATAAMTVFVGKKRPHFAVAQAGFVKAHVRSDVGCVEIEAAAKLRLAPLRIAAYPVAIQIGKMLAVDTVHLRYVLNRQCCRLNFRLLKKPRTRH